MISSLLGWVAGDGWSQFFKDKGEPWDGYLTAEAYRQRHTTEGLKALATLLRRR